MKHLVAAVVVLFLGMVPAWLSPLHHACTQSETAYDLIDLGDALAGRCEPGDLEQARATYQQALDMFTEMGAPGYVQVLEKRLNI